MNGVLVVDDKELMRDSVSTMLARAGMNVRVAADAPTALKMIAGKRPDCIVSDLKMPGMTGIELLAEVRKVDEQLPVILMTAFATVQTAVEAMKQGAFDYITKPFDGDELVMTVRRALEHAALLRENAVLKSQLGRAGRGKGPALVGESAAMRSLRDQLARIAESQATVLIMGESGVGKEVVAQTIHALSPRRQAPFLAVNCAALSSSLLESELFGHEKGAFTGAEKLRKGRFELADGGTLLLDEISEVEPAIQAKLLRVLQEQAFERVGSSVTQQTDARVIATTNRDLNRAVEAGDFRQDLYFRLHVLPVRVPALRERAEDVPALCEHFLAKIASREGRPPCRFDAAALELLQAYSWPGNVRELFNVCERAAIFAEGEVISADAIASWLGGPVRGTIKAGALSAASAVAMDDQRVLVEPKSNGSVASRGELNCEPADAVDSSTPVNGTNGHAANATGASKDDADAVVIPARGRTLEDIERDVIVATLNRFNGHRQKTARELGIGVRTLGLKLRKWKDERLVALDL